MSRQPKLDDPEGVLVILEETGQIKQTAAGLGVCAATVSRFLRRHGFVFAPCSYENRRAYNRNQRAQALGAEGWHTAGDIARLYKDQHGRCSYCGIRLFMRVKYGYCVDHVVAIVRGGSNWPTNLALSCWSCGSSKGAKSVEEYSLKLGRETNSSDSGAGGTVALA